MRAPTSTPSENCPAARRTTIRRDTSAPIEDSLLLPFRAQRTSKLQGPHIHCRSQVQHRHAVWTTLILAVVSRPQERTSFLSHWSSCQLALLRLALKRHLQPCRTLSFSRVGSSCSRLSAVHVLRSGRTPCQPPSSQQRNVLVFGSSCSVLSPFVHSS